jgi:hypothetical protein
VIRLTRPAYQATSDRAADVALIKAAMEAQGFTATEADIQWAYGGWSEDEYCAGWMSFSSPDWPQHAAKGVIKWMRDNWWTETNA